MLPQATDYTPIELKSAIVRNPLIVSPHTTVMEAITHMSGVRLHCNSTRVANNQLDQLHLEVRSSCVLVMAEDKIVGILTERDVVRLSAQYQSLDSLLIEQVMTHPVIQLRESDFTDLFSTVNLLQQHHIRHLPILDDQDHLVGLVSHESLRQISRPIDLLRLRLVEEVMTREVICATLNTCMMAIAQLMADHRISSVVIVESGGSSTNSLQIPVGMVTERDLVQFQALGLNLENCRVEAVMSAPIFAVKPEESLLNVQQMMEQHFIRRVVVTGQQKELLGIVTQTSLLQVLNPLEVYNLAQVLEKKVVRLEAEKIALLENRTLELERQVEARTATLKTQAKREKLLVEIAMQIHASLNLKTILDTTVGQVRQVLNFDRVLLYQFQRDGSGLIMAESVDDAWCSAWENSINDSGFVQQVTTLYKSEHPIVVNNIHTAGYADCHIQWLQKYQVKANLVVPIRVAGKLWGLLIGHQCADYRDWQTEDTALLQEISVQLAIALLEASTHEQLQKELSYRKQAEVALQNLIAGTAATTGRDFFPALVSHIAKALNVLYALVTEQIDQEVRILAFWANGVLQPNFSGYLITTLEQQSGEDDRFDCVHFIQQQFPQNLDRVETEVDSYLDIALRDIHGKAIGNLCILDQQPIQNLQRAEQILRVFAARAAAELERQRARTLLEQLNQDLEFTIEVRTNALREREQFLQTVLDTFPISVFWKDRNCVYLGCNRNFCCDAGLASPSEIIGKTDYDMPWGKTEADAYRADDQQTMDSDTAQLGIIETQIQANGNEIWVETNRLPLHNLKGEVMGVLGTYQDITARRQAEAQLQQSNEELARATRLKNEFLANMSHELRTPLNAILGMTEGLKEEIFGSVNEQQLKALQILERSGFHLLELINDILDVAKIESGQITLDVTPSAAALLCQSSVTFVKQEALKKGIQLEIKVPLHLPPLLIDERRIRQVLINLLNNAVKFTPEGGRITLEASLKEHSTGSSPNFLRISVIDTGIGIAPEDCEKLFEPFVQIDSALNRKYTGTGLGLAIVKRIVELHGGQVGVSSQEGVGSCFMIDLPCAAAETPFAKPELESETTPASNPPQQKLSPLILLAEDNKANISTISSYLKAKGYRILVATDGEEAIARADSSSPDLILMDIQMPGMNGIEAMQKLRQSSNSVDVPIIALTALAMESDRDRCLAAGASEYLSKPVKLKQLAALIQQLLNSKESHK